MKKVGIITMAPKRAETYANAVKWAGAEPVFITPGYDAEILDQVDGLMLTGGTDINPTMYGEEAEPETQTPDDERDQMELRLTKQAIRKNMPVLAICRGVQLLNVARAGTLIQHLRTTAHHRPNVMGKSAPAHEVSVTPRSKLARILGTTKFVANSRHHQAVHTPGLSVNVQAHADDGVTEGIVIKGKKFVVGVQWHPENELEVSEASRNLFKAFARAL